MILNLKAKTNIKDLIIDYIEVELNTGEKVSLNWDESEIIRTSDGFSARYKGVYFGEEYANGLTNKLLDLKIENICLYTETDEEVKFTIVSMEFIENLYTNKQKSFVIHKPDLSSCDFKK